MSLRRLRNLPPEAIPHIAAAGRVLAQATARMNQMSPREIALAAYTPGGPSLEQLEKLAEARLLGKTAHGIITPTNPIHEASK